VSLQSAFSSPWSQPTPYWIVIAGTSASGAGWQNAVQAAGLQPCPGLADCFAIQTSPEWVGEWERILGVLHTDTGHNQLKAALIAADTQPEAKEISLALKPMHVIQEVVQQLWLLEHLSSDKLSCCLQRVVDRRSKQVGYEAFARITLDDGTVIGGGAIMKASHALRIEYQVDRKLHKQAIDAFAACDLEGFLFINFLTGFIHRPEVYLEGLSQAVDRHHLMPRNIALDVPLSDYARDISKLRSIADYCRQRGFSLSLDDIYGTEGLGALLADIRPAFVKLDARLNAYLQDTARAGVVREIIRLAHGAGATVLAEGVENEAQFTAYMEEGVDMFQGYHFGAPEIYPPKQGAKPAAKPKK
jgi:EAL domain-containing protein (putative c-di-GMP-specific phosphodiesterase class I)